MPGPDLQKIVDQYCDDAVSEIIPLGNGLINDTYLVQAGSVKFVLQRLNALIFPEPDLIIKNLYQLNQHIQQKNQTLVKLNVPQLLKTTNDQTSVLDESGDYWRALEYLTNTESRESISHLKEAEQVGWALGHFHQLLADSAVNAFHDTLPGFHITPAYYQHYLEIKESTVAFDTDKSDYCRRFIANFSSKINVLEDAKNKGQINDRIIHGDPKLNNFLFSKETDQIVSLIDLDTVKPGLVHYDIADCLRSCCHHLPENKFDLEVCHAVLKSYLQQTHSFFSKQDYQYLYPAIELIPFELGLRFFADYLECNRYFKVNSPEQNLNRAIDLFQLCESIISQNAEIKGIIAGLTVH